MNQPKLWGFAPFSYTDVNLCILTVFRDCNMLCGRPQYALPLVRLTFDLTLKVVSESRVTWATSVPILVFLLLCVLDLGPMHASDVRQHHRLMPPPRGHVHNK